MQYDFWNNPLVVSAMRLKYRRSSPGITTCLYLLVLTAIGMTLHHYQDAYSMPPGLVFLLVILVLQFLVSGGMALFTVAGSINLEVTNRTLDFQRIVSLPPHEILLGKMIGEPAISYLLLIATVPFALICWLVGSVALGTVAWFYVNLITFTLLSAAIGTIHTLVPAASAGGMRRNSNGSLGAAFFWVPLALLPSTMSRGTGWLQDSWIGTVVNLCTPIGSLQFLFQGRPWDARVSLWGVEAPSLVVAPVIQLALTYWIVTAMSRRLKNPLDPPVRRVHTYLALFLFDLVLAGSCFDQWLNGTSTTRLLAQFGLTHLIACLVLLLCITPLKPVLVSWLWRFQRREPWLRSSCLGSRAEVTMVLPTYCAIGALVMIGGFALPTLYAANPASSAVLLYPLCEALAVSSVLILAYGMLHQFCGALAGRSGLMVYAVILLLINIVPLILAQLLIYPRQLRTVEGLSAVVASLSPATYYSFQLADRFRQTLPSGWLILAHLCLGFVCLRLLKKWLNWQRSIVVSKLTSMDVL